MKRSRLEAKAETQHVGDLSFPPPFSEQSKYLALADEFLSTNGTRNKNVVQIDSNGHFQKTTKKKKAA